MKSHDLIDERSLAFGQAIATSLVEHPEVIHSARTTLARWMVTSPPGAQPALREWLAVLDEPLGTIISLLTRDDEHATRLRQSNPFTGVLSQTQRMAILRRFESYDAAST